MSKRNLFTRIATLVMALAMLLAISSTALADTGTNSIIINNKVAGYTYRAYQIFDGTVDSTGKLSITGWGDGVDAPDYVISKLMADTELGLGVVSTDTAAQVAQKIVDKVKTDEQANALAAIFSKALKNQSGTFNYDAATGYTNSTVGDGYYMILNAVAPDGASYSRFMLEVAGNTVTVTPKPVTPTIDKVIDEDAGLTANEASIGDYVPYKITSEVPDMTGYNKYYFIIKDGLSQGLTLTVDEDHPMTITVGTKTLEKDTDYTLETTPGTNVFRIIFKDFIQYQTSQPGAAITIKYYAKLNENAIIGINGNNVDLLYSNNPMFEYKGEDEPLTGERTGRTPVERTFTYTTQLTVNKTNKETGLPLSGATFELKGTGVNTPVVTKSVTFVVSNTVVAPNAYYKLKDGTYTNIEADATTTDLYESTTVKYAKSTTTEVKSHTGLGENSAVTATTAADGTILFKGLGAGTYTLTETKAPDGFAIAEPITFTIGFSGTDDKDAKFTVDNTAITLTGTFSQYASVTIEDTRNVVLPTTGGVGTTLFYVFGSLLVIGAGVLLVTRKRMEKNDK